MKKKTILVLGSLVSFGLFAQENAKKAELSVDGEVATSTHSTTIINKSKTNTVIWSQDFANGIPAGWTNSGSSSNALWEYRGPNTTPSNATGSRGGYAGSTGPINSPTASNGFVIFDSDYLDNNGVQGNFGNGPAPTPHVASLRTDNIDLTGYPNVMLKMNSYMRYFAGRTLVAFSTDGGVTYPDTIRLHSNIPVNSRNNSGDLAKVNVSQYIGNATNVRLAFVYDGATAEPGANGLGYYYWQIDDISIEVLPDNSMEFTSWNDAPAQDIIYADGIKRGHMMEQDVTPISFDCNVLNFGAKAQTNVQLTVKVFKDGALVNTLTSPTLPVLNSGDTATYNDLTTNQFTPSGKGFYETVFIVTSDSIPVRAGSEQPMDSTYAFYVTDSVSSLDFNVLSNSIGTTALGADGSALASIIPFKAVSGSSSIKVHGLEVYFGSSTVPGGDVQVEVYDTAGFSYTGGFGGQNLVSVPFTVGASFPGSLQYLDLSANNLTLPIPGAYFFVVYMFSNANANDIFIGNDASVTQGGNSIMYNTTAARWYSGYSGSRSMESPIIRVVTEDMVIGMDEYEAVPFTVYPNPSNGSVNLNIEKGGSYKVELVNLLGQTIHTSEVTVSGNEEVNVDYSSVAKGVYLLNVSSDKGTKTVKLTLN